MSTVHFFCAICGSALTVPAGSRHLVTECSACRHIVPVPAPIELPSGADKVTAVFPLNVLALEVKFLCDACTSKLRVDVRLEGRAVICPVCQETTRVPRWSRREAPAEARLGASGDSPAVQLSAPEMEYLGGQCEDEVRASEV